VILQRMIIENFRQFHETQTLEFATDKLRNVTLVHGFNGAGKTALLNAFVWCLYGQTTPDFEYPDRLASEAAILEAPEGGRVVVRVRLVFQAREGQYVVERTQDFIRKGNDQVPETPKLTLSIQKKGEAELTPIESAAQARIHSLLSPNLYPFFFFNGERVERLASADAYEQVEEGIKSLLEIKIYERSLHHLRDVVSRDLAAELKKHGGEELQAALSQLESLTETQGGLVEAERRTQGEITALQEEKETFERAQNELESLSLLVREREALRKERTIHKRTLGERTRELAKALSDNGYLGLAAPELEATKTAVATARHRGELPAKIKPQFVDDLLQRELCICGRPLNDHHPTELAALKTWRQNTGLAEYEEAVSQASAAVRDLEARRQSYFTSVDDLQAKRSTAKSEISRLDDQLDELEAKISDPTAGERAVDLAAQIERLNGALIDAKAALIALQRQLADNRTALADLERQLEKLKASDQQGELIKRRRAAVEKIASVLEQIYKLRKDDVRQDLNARIARLWDDAAIKDYTASLNQEFQLKLTKQVAGTEQPVHGASTGEKQVLALSFVGSLVEKARDNLDEAKDAEITERGGLYPLVMDSPFGSLEDDYRAKVAEWIPKLANQVVILVSKTQWREEVEREVRPKVGREYILELHSTKSGSGRAIDIGSDTFPYVVETTDPYERTKIEKVSQ